MAKCYVASKSVLIISFPNKMVGPSNILCNLQRFTKDLFQPLNPKTLIESVMRSSV